MNSNHAYADYLAQLETGLSLLPDKPEETASSSLHALWHLAAGNAYSVERADRIPRPDLSPEAHRILAELIQRRLSGIPLAHITQRQEFMQLEFIVGPDALVPRKETQLLASMALDLLNEIVQQQDSAIVLDVCTGAGNIALSLAHHQIKCRVFAADLSADAIALANRNKIHLQLESRVEFFVGDLLTPFANEHFLNQVDLLTCNPPYISSGRLDKMPDEIALHEPQIAFDGGPFGLSLVGKLLKEAPLYLKPNSWLVFEVGQGQGEPLLKRLSRNQDYRRVKPLQDQDGNVRVLALQV